MNVHPNSFGTMRRFTDGPLTALTARLHAAAVEAGQKAGKSTEAAAAAREAGERVERLAAVRLACDANEWGTGVRELVELLVEGDVALTGPEYRLLREAARWARLGDGALRPLSRVPLHPLCGFGRARVREWVEIVDTLYGRRIAGSIAERDERPDHGAVGAVGAVEQVITSLGVTRALVGDRDRQILARLAAAMGIDGALVARIPEPRPQAPDEDFVDGGRAPGAF